MSRSSFLRRGILVLWAALWASPGTASAQQTLTWDQVRERFIAQNPTVLAGRLGVDETRAQAITASLRPNPTLTVAFDQIDLVTTHPFDPFVNLLWVTSVSYLHERDQKRELRQDTAHQATAIAVVSQTDLERTLLFTVRTAFIGILQAKATSTLARDNLAAYDQSLGVQRARLAAGDIAQVDLDRLELQRFQLESDLQTADTNLRTAKIQLVALLNDRTPIDQFDVTGPFDYAETPRTLDELRQTALATRPDLQAAQQSVAKAKTDHQLALANGSIDPTFGFDVGRNPPLQHYVGVNVSVPLRVFDRNQGEKLRTEIDVEKEQRMLDATQAQILNDVDSAYATLVGALTVLRPYKTQYLPQAAKVRDTVTFSFQNGGASLLDFLDAQRAYRDVQVSYVNLIGSYLTAVNQLNLALGREEIR